MLSSYENGCFCTKTSFANGCFGFYGGLHNVYWSKPRSRPTCQRLQDAGVVINRPPRDGYMAFIRSPDNISIELLQKGKALPPQEPWLSAQNIGHW